MREQQLALRQTLILTIVDLFHQYDADNSGTLGMKELDDLLTMFKAPAIAARFAEAGMDVNEVQEAIVYSDADGSGEVDYEEFLIGVTKMDEESVRCDTLELQSRIRVLLHTEQVNHQLLEGKILGSSSTMRKAGDGSIERMARKAHAFQEAYAAAGL